MNEVDEPFDPYQEVTVAICAIHQVEMDKDGYCEVCHFELLAAGYDETDRADEIYDDWKDKEDAA